jgi:antitoxin YefM
LAGKIGEPTAEVAAGPCSVVMKRHWGGLRGDSMAMLGSAAGMHRPTGASRVSGWPRFYFLRSPMPTRASRSSMDRKPIRVYRREMRTVSYTEARERLAGIWDEVLSTREAVVILRRGKESVVLVALDEWAGLQETVHLLRSPANAQRLLAALQRLGEGEGVVKTFEEIQHSTGAA